MARASALNTTNHLGESGNVERHWRIHDELRHSLRSVFKTYGKYASAIDNFFVLSADLPYDSDRRIGMVPTWLDIHHPFHHRSQIRPVFPWQIHRTSAFPSQEAAEQWRQESLPVFNSMAVESQFANIPSENDIWLMSCDDFFLLNDQTPSDVSVLLSTLYPPMH